MFSPTLQHSPWRRWRDFTSGEISQNAERSHATDSTHVNLIFKGIKSHILLIWLLVYNVFSFVFSVLTVVAAVIVIPILLFGTLALIGLALYFLGMIVKAFALLARF